MRAFMLKSVIVLLASALQSCGPADQSAYHGGLLFGQASYLMRFSLSDGSLSAIDNLGDKTIREISALGPDKLLIAETASVNRKDVPRISWIDLQTGQSTVLYSGVLARYLAGAGVIVYDDGSSLYAVPQLGSGTDEVILSHRPNQLIAMLVVSGDVLLFEAGDTDRGVIRSWDAESGELRPLDALTAACRLEGAVWIDTLERLACRNRAAAHADGEYVLAGLDGVVDGKLKLPENKQFLALAFISGQNAVILKESWHGLFGGQDKSAVWAHDIRSGESRRLARNQDLGSSVVYAEF
jgi:hypothetical protein